MWSHSLLKIKIISNKPLWILTSPRGQLVLYTRYFAGIPQHNINFVFQLWTQSGRTSNRQKAGIISLMTAISTINSYTTGLISQNKKLSDLEFKPRSHKAHIKWKLPTVTIMIPTYKVLNLLECLAFYRQRVISMWFMPKGNSIHTGARHSNRKALIIYREPKFR